MQIGDWVKLSIRGAVSLCMGRMHDPDKYGTGVFLGWARGSEYIATVYWLGGYGYKDTHIDYFEKILDKSSEQDTLLT